MTDLHPSVKKITDQMMTESMREYMLECMKIVAEHNPEILFGLWNKANHDLHQRARKNMDEWPFPEQMLASLIFEEALQGSTMQPAMDKIIARSNECP